MGGIDVSETFLVKEQFLSLLNFGQNYFVQFRWNWFSVLLPVTNTWELPFVVYSILKQCWSVGYVSLLTLSFILNYTLLKIPLLTPTYTLRAKSNKYCTIVLGTWTVIWMFRQGFYYGICKSFSPLVYREPLLWSITSMHMTCMTLLIPIYQLPIL